jgi:acyl-CoA dehydrogenase
MNHPFETEERQAFRQTISRFVRQEILPYADEWDEAGETPWRLHGKAGELGVFGFGIDERYGGLGFDDAFMRAIYAEEISKCGATGVAADLGARTISIRPVHESGSAEIKSRVLPPVVAGDIGSSLAVSEPGGGSDVARLRTGGISLFLVDAGTAGFSRQPMERKMGWWCSDTASLFFDECRVPAANMLGREGEGFRALAKNFNFERFFMAARKDGPSAGA